jgi:hypothetical protein
MNEIKLNLKKKLFGEIAHYYDSQSGDIILSEANQFYINIDNQEHKIIIPFSNYFFLILKKYRIFRRLFRIDKSNAVLNFKKDGLVIIYYKKIYFYDLKKKIIAIVGNLINSRNALHNGVAVTKDGIFFGEYGSNIKKNKVPVWGSYDDGRSWKIVYNFSNNSIKHVHGIYNDLYEDNLWITTGDMNSECFLFKIVKKNFKNVVKYGDGTQKWRSVNLFFKKESIIWIMDSPLEICSLQIFDRKTGIITKGQSFPGPVWYGKMFDDNSAVIQTSVEIGPGVKSNFSTLFYSKNLTNWFAVKSFKKDIFSKKLFKFGVIAFSEGSQNSRNFLLHAEGLNKIDGRVFLSEIR